MKTKQQQVARCVFYEWWMFDQMFQRIRSLSGRGANQIDKNMYLECFLIHARNLRDFLTRSRRTANKRKPHRDDVLAEDYFTQGQKWTVPSVPTYLKANHKRLNGALAHLSYGRIDYEVQGKTWNVRKVHEELNSMWSRFLEAISEEQRNWFMR